jgi:hypothetical protein
VRLLGVPEKHQGTHDSLCAYYAAAMLLTALRPELEDDFDAAHVARDPIFAGLPRRNGQPIERRVSAWLAAGERLEAVCAALNRAGAPTTRFAFRYAARSAKTLALLERQIDVGLPCVLAWESGEMGNHTVLVVGYERYRGQTRWLRVHDPSRVQQLLEWGQLTRLADRRLELLCCTQHDGVRPNRLTSERTGSGKLMPGKTRIGRWERHSKRYQQLI